MSEPSFQASHLSRNNFFKQKNFFLKTVSENWTKLEMVELKHPKTEKGHLFAFNEDHSQIKEVTCVNEPYGSWFIGDTIETDGRLQMLADFDPLLLIIPYLRASERPMPLDHVLNDDDFPYTEYLVNVHSKMDQIGMHYSLQN